MSVEVWLTIDEAAALESISLDSMLKRIQRNRASFTTRQIPSEKQLNKNVTQILLTSLSPAAQRRWRDAHVEAAAEVTTALEPARPANDAQQEWFNALPMAYKERVVARLNIVNEFRQTVDAIGLRSFGYRGEVAADVASRHGISRGTLHRLVSAYEKQGLPGLADNRFGQRRAKITPEMENYIIGLIGKRPHRRPIRILEHLENEFHAGISYTTVHRWVMAWKERNRELITTLVNPDDAKNKFQWAPGDMDAKAEFFCHYVEMDSTPADVLCNDGKRYAIVGAIDVYSRMPMFHVAPTSNKNAIAALFRRIVTEWGVPHNVVKDNGQDYVSKHVTQIQAAFGIHSPYVPKFTPEAKPHIERLFGTMARGCLEELAGYIGHSVAERKGIEARRSFADRIMNNNEVIEVGLTPEQLQAVLDSYAVNILAQRRHGELGVSPEVKRGQSPKQPARVTDLAALEIVLLEEAIRTVNKKGIKIDNGTFFSVDLATRVRPGEKVRVKIDGDDITKLHVFDMVGRYLCAAWDTKARPVTAAEAAKVKKEQKQAMRAKVKAVQALADVLPDPTAALLGLKQAEKKIVAFRGSVPFGNEALTEAARAAGGLGQEPIGQRLLREFQETGTD